MFTATALEIISEKHPSAFYFDAQNMRELVGISLQTCDIYKLHGYTHGLSAIFQNVTRHNPDDINRLFLQKVELILGIVIF